MTPEQWTWLLCSVSVMLENKLTLQELNQLIGIKLLDFRFSRNLLVPRPNFQGGNARFAPPLHLQTSMEKMLTSID